MPISPVWRVPQASSECMHSIRWMRGEVVRLKDYRDQDLLRLHSRFRVASARKRQRRHARWLNKSPDFKKRLASWFSSAHFPISAVPTFLPSSMNTTDVYFPLSTETISGDANV